MRQFEINEYKCIDCNNEFKSTSILKKKEAKCYKCNNKDKVEKEIKIIEHAPPVHFKGLGWTEKR